MKQTIDRAKFLRITLTVLLAGVFLVGVGALVVDRLRVVEDAVVDLGDGSTPETVATVPGGCDFDTSAEECPVPEQIAASTLDGAVERYRAGVFATADARFLVLSPADYEALLRPVLGPATPHEGTVVLGVPVWEASFGDLSRSEVFSWEQQWRLVGGAVMFEQLFVLGSTEEPATFLANHAAFMDDLGVRPTVHPITGRGVSGEPPLLFRFIDADAIDPARRCVNRAIGVVDRVVFSVTLMTGGDCSTPDLSLPVGILSAVRDRAAALLG